MTNDILPRLAHRASVSASLQTVTMAAPWGRKCGQSGEALILSFMNFYSSHLSDFIESLDKVSEQLSRVNFPGQYQPALMAARLKSYGIAVSVGEFPFTDLGSYPRFAIASDCSVICPKCCKTEISSIMVADRSDGWLLVADSVNYEDDSLYCDNCNDRIPSAYNEPAE